MVKVIVKDRSVTAPTQKTLAIIAIDEKGNATVEHVDELTEVVVRSG